jgi:hypothetical protein
MSNIYRPPSVVFYDLNAHGTISYETTGCGCCGEYGTQSAEETIRELEESMREMAALIEVLRATKEVRA